MAVTKLFENLEDQVPTILEEIAPGENISWTYEFQMIPDPVSGQASAAVAIILRASSGIIGDYQWNIGLIPAGEAENIHSLKAFLRQMWEGIVRQRSANLGTPVNANSQIVLPR